MSRSIFKNERNQIIHKLYIKVLLIHQPTGLRVECQQSRSLETNRGIAKKWLQEKYDMIYKPEQSKILRKYEKIKNSKRNSRKKAHRKYHQPSPSIENK